MTLKDERDAIKRTFEERNIEIEFYNSRIDIVNSIKSELCNHITVGIGNSQTLKALNISEMAVDMGKVVYDKSLADTVEEVNEVKRKALISDCYITSCNAFSKDGRIINVDHSGNRVAAMTYGPDRVLIIVGENKLENTEKDAVKRALTIATPLNAKRAKIDSPCSRGESCELCTQSVRVCNYLSIIRGQQNSGRMKLLVINEELGF